MILHLTATGNHMSMGSHSVTCHPTESIIPAITPAEAGTRFIDPRIRMKGCVCLSNAREFLAQGNYVMTKWRDRG